MKIYRIADAVYENEDQPCPDCGSIKHHIANAVNPTVNECVNCGNIWNPDNYNQEVEDSLAWTSLSDLNETIEELRKENYYLLKHKR